MNRPERLGRYRVVAELGNGAMGAVYEAIDDRLERPIAIKTIALGASQQGDAEFRARFEREAKSAARLNHPGIVTIYESGEDNGVAYIAMEFLKGASLRSRLDRGDRFSLDEVVEIGIAAAEALDFAHEHGVVHRDIKPSNLIRLDNGGVKITDFGVAHYVNEDLTQVGTVIGTPKYMSPEQVNSERIDGRSDLFSLGVVLYELAAGEAPFVGSSIASIMFQVIHHQPLDPRRINPDISAGLAWVIGKCLAKRPGDRYSSGRKLADDLRNVTTLTVPADVFAAIYSPERTAAASNSTRAPAESTIVIAHPAATRRWWWIGSALAGAVVVALVGTWMARHRAAAPPAPAVAVAVAPTNAGASSNSAVTAGAPAPSSPSSPPAAPTGAASAPSTLTATPTPLLPTPSPATPSPSATVTSTAATSAPPTAPATTHAPHKPAHRPLTVARDAHASPATSGGADPASPSAETAGEASASRSGTRATSFMDRVSANVKAFFRKYRDCVTGKECEKQVERDHSYDGGN